MSTEDLTGHPLPEKDVDEAIAAVRGVLLRPHLMRDIPVQLTVSLPNIYRCLVLLKAQYIAKRLLLPEGGQ